ncbi:MAG: tripartite tricarboxylate transporter substrate binding protein [Burkholderiales bacterium]|nr:tripartite tricarboxylate transporter substrate binding protein [Burkholderiales bacterium]
MGKFNALLGRFVLLAMSSFAGAADYPTRPVRLLVAYPAGGGDDLHGRLIAEKLTQIYDKQFIVDNRPSAGGVLGFDLASKATPDGYTLLLAGANLTIVPHLRRHLNFKVPDDFTPISQISRFQLMMVAHPSVPVRSIKDLIALAKAQPGKLSFGSSGVGATPHLAGELFKHMAGVDVVHIPYKGGTTALTDLLAGRIELYIGTMTTVTPLVKDNKVRALAVTGMRRSSMLPQVPTMEESGLSGYELSSWYGIFAPAGIPQNILASLNASIRKAVEMPDVVARLASVNVEVAVSSQENFAQLVRATYEKFGRIIRDAGIKAD